MSNAGSCSGGSSTSLSWAQMRGIIIASAGRDVKAPQEYVEEVEGVADEEVPAGAVEKAEDGGRKKTDSAT